VTKAQPDSVATPALVEGVVRSQALTAGAGFQLILARPVFARRGLQAAAGVQATGAQVLASGEPSVLRETHWAMIVSAAEFPCERRGCFRSKQAGQRAAPAFERIPRRGRKAWRRRRARNGRTTPFGFGARTGMDAAYNQWLLPKCGL